MQIRAKLIIIISVVLLLAVGASTIFFISSQQQRLVENKVTDVEVLGGIIISAINDAMSMGQTALVQQTLENMHENPEILSLRILSPEGLILKSMLPEEVGRDAESFALLRDGTLRKTSFIDGDTLSYFLPIRNNIECHGCHAETTSINGIVEVTADISRSRADILAARRELVLSGTATVTIVGFILALALNRMVLAPVTSLKRTMKAIEEGDLEARMEVSTMDDMGRLARSFNRMLDEVSSLQQKSLEKEKDISRVRAELSHKALLEELNTELQYKVREVESANKAVLKLSKEVKSKNIELEQMVTRLKKINEIGRVLASIIDYKDLLKIIIKTAADTIKADNAALYISRGKQKKAMVVYDRDLGVDTTDREAEDVNPFFREILTDGRQILINEEVAAPGTGGLCQLGGPMKMKGQIIGAVLLWKKSDGNHFTHDELEILDTITYQAVVALENSWLYETVKTNYFGTIQSLVNALEASDNYTKGHSERVRFMVLELAKHIGFDSRELEVLEHAAILHDIGKIGIDTSVLNKQEELTSSEFSLIKAHPIIGDEILGPIGTLQGVRTTILQHHERYDGKGYPYGISGEEITLKARLLTVIDTFDAMVTDRPYRKALSFDEVLDELRKGSGSQFDPVILNAFMDMIKERESLLTEAGYNFF